MSMKLSEAHKKQLTEVTAHIDQHPISELSVGKRRHRHSLTARLVRSRGRMLVICSQEHLNQVARQYIACNIKTYVPKDPHPGEGGHATEDPRSINADGTATVWAAGALDDKRVARRYRTIVIDVPGKELPAALSWAKKWRESPQRGGRIIIWDESPSEAHDKAGGGTGIPRLEVEWNTSSWSQRIEAAEAELPGKQGKKRAERRAEQAKRREANKEASLQAEREAAQREEHRKMLEELPEWKKPSWLKRPKKDHPTEAEPLTPPSHRPTEPSWNPPLRLSGPRHAQRRRPRE